MTVALIGTAGRDWRKPMSLALWQWMLTHAAEHVPRGAHVVSGGAAWSDHLAVALFLADHAGALTLHLPCPFKAARFEGPAKSSAAAANFYHEKFSATIRQESRAQIDAAIARGAVVTFQPSQPGYAGMFARNALVAASDVLYAYTFGTGNAPEDGGTAHTWKLCTGARLHVSLPSR